MMQTTSIVNKTFMVLEKANGMGESYNKRSQEGVNLFIIFTSTFNKETHQIMCDFGKHQVTCKLKHLVHCLIPIPYPSQAKQANSFKIQKKLLIPQLTKLNNKLVKWKCIQWMVVNICMNHWLLGTKSSANSITQPINFVLLWASLRVHM
jgi:hypothetical protein